MLSTTSFKINLHFKCFRICVRYIQPFISTYINVIIIFLVKKKKILRLYELLKKYLFLLKYFKYIHNFPSKIGFILHVFFFYYHDESISNQVNKKTMVNQAHNLCSRASKSSFNVWCPQFLSWASCQSRIQNKNRWGVHSFIK